MIEFDYLPMLPQTAPVDAKELYEAFDRNLEASESTYSGHRFEVSGIATKVGPDVHSKPSIELSDAKSGKCYVLCVFNSKALRLELKKSEGQRMDIDTFLETVRRYTTAIDFCQSRNIGIIGS